VKSCADMITSPQVLIPVIQQLVVAAAGTLHRQQLTDGLGALEGRFY
jgi:hypothetical protein